MSTPYGGNDQQWEQQGSGDSGSEGSAQPQPSSGGFPAQGQPGSGSFPAQQPHQQQQQQWAHPGAPQPYGQPGQQQWQQPAYGGQAPAGQQPQQSYGQDPAQQQHQQQWANPAAQQQGAQQWQQQWAPQAGQPQPYGQPGHQQQWQQPYGGPPQTQQPHPYGQPPGGAYPASGPLPQLQPGAPAHSGYASAAQENPAQPYAAQQYPGQGYPAAGAQDYPGAPSSAEQPGKSNAPLWVGVGVLALIVVVIGVLGFVAPGWFNTTVFDQSAMQAGVEKILREQYQIPDVQGVSCPDGQEVEVGNTFDCTAIIAGEQRAVPITVTGNDGKYEVGKPAP